MSRTMYIAKIPGTKYITSLESQGGSWSLQLKLGDSIEAQLETDLNSRAIKNKLADLFKKVNLQINNFQLDLIHKELISQIQHLLMQAEHKPTQSKPKSDDSPRYDPRVDELFEKLDKLENTLRTLSERIERIESMNT